ncbi:T9SS C-terminal target domain-containing protein [Mariniphaga sediminis]|uniref:T9SS C-terminal target domain-containing protein n=1 Tax=Mariniphaga sediminis TaxID=1628158 RepID=A0A399CXU6_9BACT|nr:T9SS type A sorting domain-containing protein [Mariniphaga sediminis]RIH62890.1 T9SS C-terminal target domain-containing protein [Mariniphaga sediminis]
MKLKITLLIHIGIITLTALGQNSGHEVPYIGKFKLDSITSQHWNAFNSQWDPSNVSTYNYDTQYNMVQYLDFSYEILTKEWIIFDKNEFVYDVNNNKTEKIVYRKYDSRLIPAYKLKYIYNNKGLIDSSLFYGWDYVIEQWNSSASSKEQYTYNSNDELTIQNTYSPNENTREWEDYKKVEYSYNSNGQLIEMTSFYVKRNASEWSNLEKREYKYDSTGNEIQFVYRIFNESTNQWDNKRKIENTFLEDTLQSIDFKWDKTSEDWISNSKIDLLYDPKGNLVEITSFNNNTESGQWTPSSKDVFSYDLTVEYQELILPPQNLILRGIFTLLKQQNIKNKPQSYSKFYWTENNQDWVLSENGTFHYSKITVNSILETNAKNILIYPNPVNENLFFETQNLSGPVTFKLYDLLGREILNKEVSFTNCIKTTHLKKGHYIYLIETNGKQQAGKLIKN